MPPVPSRPSLRAGAYALLAAGFLAFAVYGSWVPFHFRAIPWHEAVEQFADVCAQPIRVRSISDWTANVVLFVPIGFTLLAACGVDRARWVGIVAAPVLAGFCVLASTAIEFSQLYFPGRVASINDIVAQTVGTALGMLVWLCAGQRLTERFRETWAALGSQGLTARILPGYLAFLLLVHTMPFDLTLSPVEVYHKYRAGRVHVLPFEFGPGTLSTLLMKQVWNLIYFVPPGILLARLDRPRWRELRSWWRVAGIGLAAAGTIQFAKLFVESRNCEAADVLVDALAVLLGWTICVLPLAARTQSSELVPATAKSLIDVLDRRWLLAGWVMLLLLLSWYPFDFGPGLAEGLNRLLAVSFVPFADYQTTSRFQAFDQAVHKVLLFVPLGALLAAVLRDERKERGFATMVAAGVLALVLEVGQAFLPARFPSATDVLLETSGAWAGLALYRHSSARGLESRAAEGVT